MTSVVSWVGVDSRGPASIYIASDSRISWGEVATWDHGRKVFACSSSPEIFGYAGASLFPSIFLSQLTGILSSKALGDLREPGSRVCQIVDCAKSSHDSFPIEVADRRSFKIVYCCRVGENMDSRFFAFLIAYDSETSQWTSQELPIPSVSGLIHAEGSGANAVREHVARWKKSEQGGTSRAIFSGFCDSLRSSRDPLSGGAPQLVGIKRSFAAAHYGIIWNESLHQLGLRMTSELRDGSGTEWMNELFERCDFVTLKPLSGAQRHCRPRSL